MHQEIRRILMIAYHFPPLTGSSGIQRTLRFVQHLPSFGWQALVLSANPRAYEMRSDDLMAEVPLGTVVRRAFALDAARHMSVGGRYLDALARPDRWMSWRFDAIRQGLAMIQEYRPQAIWSTFPIPTAHRIGLELQRRSGLPWVADFRDPMAQEGYPPEPRLWRAYSQLEKQTVAQARVCCFTTPGTCRRYRERYPERANVMHLLENGFDEESFVRAERVWGSTAPLEPGRLTLVHSGIVYPSERDPTQLFMALKRLVHQGELSPDQLRIRFRAAGHAELIQSLAAQQGVAAFIDTPSPIPYGDALQEMRCADGLLLMQGSSCNEQIPAKTYEYLRAGRPVLCLADPLGDTAGVVRQAGLNAIVRLDDAPAIARGLIEFLSSIRAGTAVLPDSAAVSRASRRGRSEQLAALLDTLA